jgi:hypothetical protein
VIFTKHEDEQDKLNFAKEAAEHFVEHSNHWTYTNEYPAAGCWFAVKWGMDSDCVLIFKLDKNITPIIYTQIMRDSLDAKEEHLKEVKK